MNKKEQKQLERAIRKLREVALDLREPQDGANIEHQADKIDGVIDDIVPLVHGGGTGGLEAQILELLDELRERLKKLRGTGGQ